MTMSALEAALRTRPGPSIVAYVTAGFPDRARFLEALAQLESCADAVEIGVPFSDPMADGPTIQRASHAALLAGATLEGTLSDLAARPPRRPRVLMSYLNPLLALPHDTLAPRLAAAHVSGLVVPDLPHDESDALASALAAVAIALVPMVTPLTGPDRLAAIVQRARGFVYAVTSTGTTGRSVDASAALTTYLARVRALTRVPVIAGFGVRSATDVAALCPPADGVVIGSALVEAMEAGRALDAVVARLRCG